MSNKTKRKHTQAKKRKASDVFVKNPYYPLNEAKKMISDHYKKLGYKVARIRADKQHAVIHASFGTAQNGSGRGPWGLAVVTLNWPKQYNTHAAVGFAQS